MAPVCACVRPGTSAPLPACMCAFARHMPHACTSELRPTRTTRVGALTQYNMRTLCPIVTVPLFSLFILLLLLRVFVLKRHVTNWRLLIGIYLVTLLTFLLAGIVYRMNPFLTRPNSYSATASNSF